MKEGGFTPSLAIFGKNKVGWALEWLFFGVSTRVS